MAKVKKQFICTNCGASSPKWMGQCPACHEWNTLVEEVIHKPSLKNELKQWSNPDGSKKRPTLLQDVKTGSTQRLVTPDQELNRVLGGGIVPGSLILVGGQPGIGKSTLLLQLAVSMKLKVLYLSGEESEEQIRMRAERIGIKNDQCYLFAETSTQAVINQYKQLQPDIIVVDSIQTIHSPMLDATPGSVSQIRECAGEFQRLAKTAQVPIFLIGHITKDGQLAGPKLLEHIVDTVLQFEGDRHHTYRILRTLKNRFGSTAELGIYEMRQTGLREVSNPSELLLSQKEEDLSGSAVAATLEGLRPMLIETQALVSKAVYGNPQRSATGFDLRRLNMLLAVLEKRGGMAFSTQDVFLNLAGGIRIDDPALDLAIVAALISSLSDISVPSNYCFAGEVGLSGEVRAVNRVEQRIQEAARLGFQKIFISKYNQKGLEAYRKKIEIIPIAKIGDLLGKLFA
ncbi:MAG: DNA repair protein RadA [Bacteroidota bacterium]